MAVAQRVIAVTVALAVRLGADIAVVHPAAEERVLSAFYPVMDRAVIQHEHVRIEQTLIV
jgi:hypothetical protein